MHLHQQSHLYPCQLSSILLPSNNTQKFIFHSPINPYSTVYNPMTNDCDFLNNEEVRYSRLSTIDVGQIQKYALLSNSNNISFVGRSDKILRSIHLNAQQEIISDIARLPQSFVDHSSKSRDRTFLLAYLSATILQQQESTFLTIKKIYQNHYSNKKQQNPINPESQKSIKTQEDSCQTFIDSQGHDELNQVSSIKLNIPLTKSKHSSLNSIQISFNHLNHNNTTLSLFDKHSSILYTYDPEYQTFISTIPCSQDSENQLVTEYQSNKISFLSQNLIVNSHQNGVIKLIDQRVGSIVHTRNLSEEMTLFGQRASVQRQQNVIKFWNQEKTQTVDSATNSTSQFLINLKNHIYQVDLRNNRLLKQDSVFKFQSNQLLTNYEIAQSKNESICAFTTEGHSNYKGHVVKRSKNQ